MRDKLFLLVLVSLFWAILVLISTDGRRSAHTSFKHTADSLADSSADSSAHSSAARSMPSTVTGSVFTGEPMRGSAIPDGLFPLNRLTASAPPCSIPMVGVTTTLKGRARCIDETSRVIPILVVGDEGGETYNSSQNIVYLSVSAQRGLYPLLDRHIPMRSFSRKNFGFMHAFLAMNACAVWDFDDDNCPSDATSALLSQPDFGRPPFWLASELSVTNPYLLFGSPEHISPRGMPLEFLSKREFPRLVEFAEKVQTDVIQVIQSLEPDVDAVWRLLHADQLPMHWIQSPALTGQLVGIHPSNMAPFNAQATMLSRRALSIAFLPSTVHGRVSDIWRSYIMQYLTVSPL